MECEVRLFRLIRLLRLCDLGENLIKDRIRQSNHFLIRAILDRMLNEDSCSLKTERIALGFRRSNKFG